MKKIVFLLLLLVGTSVRLSAKPVVYVIDLKKEVGSTTWIYMKEGFKKAREVNADRILIHENTYGGMVLYADSIRTLILNSSIPVSTFIDNNAASAGALIAIACDSIYMTKGASIGAATVVNETQEKMPDKYQSYMRATIRATAEAKGKVWRITSQGDSIAVWRRDPRIAEAMVDENLPSIAGVRDSGKIVTFTTNEALVKGFCDGKVESIQEIVEQRWKWSDYEIKQYTPTVFDEVLGFLSNPAFQAILIMLILGGIYFELQSPGIGFPTVIAIGAAVLYFAPLYLEGLAMNWEIALFVLGILLLAAEIFVIPGFGIAGIAGIILTVMGLVLALVDNLIFDFTGVATQDMGYAIWTVIIGLVGGVALTFFIASKIGAKGLLHRVALNEAQDNNLGYTSHDEKLNELIGMAGEAETDMRPVGKILLHGDLYDATSLNGFLEKGTEVKVEKVENGLLFVKPIRSSNLPPEKV